jgi:hypothetical protein
MTDDRTMHPECAQNFGKLSAEIRSLRDEDGVSRSEFRVLRDSINANHQTVMNSLSLVREDVSALKVKASMWGALGGAITAAIAAIIAVLGSIIK